MSILETIRRPSVEAPNPNPQHPEPLIGADEASQYLGFAAITILRMAHKGLLPTIAFPIGATGKFRFKFKLSELEAYVLTLARPIAA